uniref:Immunoglobulin domain-containing protein n=1 Tax=Colobus angolensis palliatus TaxID=336983 RepID=A0A2K5IXE9_COLAP
MLLWSLLVIFAAVTEQADSLTLVAPSSVFEGDSIVLKCQGEQNWKIQTMAYHKDNKELSVFKKVSDFLIQSAVLSDSGNYFCSTKGNIFSWHKRSNIVKIKVQGPDGHRRDFTTAGVLWGLFGVLGFTGVALLLYSLFHKISGESSATNEPRAGCRLNPQEFTYSSPIPKMEELQPVYVNANIRTLLENKDSQVIYSSVKKS